MIFIQLLLYTFVASVHSFVGFRDVLCNSSIRSTVDGNHNFFLLSAEVNGYQDQNALKAPDSSEENQTNKSREEPAIPLSAYDLDPLPEESKTSILNLEMIPYDYYRSTRLVQGRSYARETAFQKENLNSLPTLQDLSSPKQKESDIFWSTSLYRVGVFFIAYYSFPPLLQFLNSQETIPLSLFHELTDNFSTGVSILYGTIISLTLNILYERQKSITEQIATESSLLVMLTRNTLTLFRNDEQNVKAVGKCITDQVRILVKESRGKELITLIYADPYGRLLDLLNSEKVDSGRNEGLINSTRDIIKDMIKSRSIRLSRESSGLPPTHFFILSLLTFIILLSNILSTLSELVDGEPPFESGLFFALFATVYVIFFNFATDLDNPFGGVYQIRRSAIAANLLQTKNLLINEPVLKDVISFDDDMTINGSL